MKVINLPLSKLKKPERNVRIHTEKQLREFERSIAMFGQIRPLVVDETNTILAGVGCYETLLRMGAAEASVYRIENLTENQKKKLMIADNKLFGLGIDDLDTFNEFLSELQTDLDIPGFDEDLLQSMVGEAAAISEKISEYGIIDQSEIDSMVVAREKKQEIITKAEVQTQAPVPTPSAETPQPQTGTTTDETTAEVRRSVTCPKCGEKIWL